MSEVERIMQAAMSMARRMEPCILCGKRTKQIGLFFPNHSQAFGAPKGKTRVIVYALCEDHPINAETQEETEQRILSEYGASLN